MAEQGGGAAAPRMDGYVVGRWVFRLYVSSASPISARAIVNARKLLDSHLEGLYDLTILNIADHVERAREDQIVASPTLVRVHPLPLRRLIGDMSNVVKLSVALGLPAAPRRS